MAIASCFVTPPSTTSFAAATFSSWLYFLCFVTSRASSPSAL